jgi:hypothetical protein
VVVYLVVKILLSTSWFLAGLQAPLPKSKASLHRRCFFVKGFFDIFSAYKGIIWHNYSKLSQEMQLLQRFVLSIVYLYWYNVILRGRVDKGCNIALSL